MLSHPGVGVGVGVDGGDEDEDEGAVMVVAVAGLLELQEDQVVDATSQR
jgi:hypothetical protein